MPHAVICLFLLSACLQEFPTLPAARIAPDGGLVPDTAPQPLVDMAIPEQCNGEDDDGDGYSDEGFPVGGPCSTGVGECAADGEFRCTPAGDRICSALPASPTNEQCNGLDDDCDGNTDEDYDSLGLACSVGTGACQSAGTIACGENGLPTCAAEIGQSTAEICNGLDDDCDGFADETFADLGEACTEGFGSCASPGVVVCGEDGLAAVCDAEARNAAQEACNGLDDDCDESVDEEQVCGQYVNDHCTLWLGWSQFGLGPMAPSPSWGACPDEAAGAGPNVRCTSTAPDSEYGFLALGDNYEFNADDTLAFAFTCADNEAPLVAQWLQTNCTVFVGHTEADAPPETADSWGDCPDSLAGPGPQACTSSARDGQFHTLGFRGFVDEDDHFGVAFVCRDPAQADRAANVTAAVEVRFAWAHSVEAEAALLADGCPSQDPSYACATTAGDGLFHSFSIGAPVFARPGEDGDRFGISLQPR